jgi:hypothetical protein
MSLTFKLSISLGPESDLPVGLLDDISEQLWIEDRSTEGWGIVIGLDDEFPTLSEGVDRFRNVFGENAALVLKTTALLRVAVFNPNFTMRLSIEDTAALASICKSMIASIYPVSN